MDFSFERFYEINIGKHPIVACPHYMRGEILTPGKANLLTFSVTLLIDFNHEYFDMLSHEYCLKIIICLTWNTCFSEEYTLCKLKSNFGIFGNFITDKNHA